MKLTSLMFGGAETTRKQAPTLGRASKLLVRIPVLEMALPNQCCYSRAVVVLDRIST